MQKPGRPRSEQSSPRAMTVNGVRQVTRMAGVRVRVPRKRRRVCWANNLLGGLTHRWPTKPPSSWGQSRACWGLDPRFVSLRLCLLAVSALLSTLGPVGKMAARAPARAIKPSGWVGTPMAPEQPRAWVQANARRAQTPAVLGLGLCLCTSVCPITLGLETKMEVSLS